MIFTYIGAICTSEHAQMTSYVLNFLNMVLFQREYLLPKIKITILLTKYNIINEHINKNIDYTHTVSS